MRAPKPPHVGIIGAGNIGAELYRKVLNLGWEVTFVAKSDGVYKNLTNKIDRLENYLNYASGLDVIFLAIPTLDDGTAAYEYLLSFLKLNIPVVTCEKGSLSSHFAELEPYRHRIGYSATVGGGTRLLRYMEGHVGPWTQEIHGVINGTLNYLLSEVAAGKPMGAAIADVQRLGYAEPGVNGVLEIINQEAKEDVVMKTAILFNLSNFERERRLKASDMKVCEITDAEVDQLIREAGKRRFIVSITRGARQRDDTIGGFRHQVGEWNIRGGFQALESNPLFSQLVLPGIVNGVIVYEGGENTYRATGPGAGAVPTTSAMVKDELRLLASASPAHAQRS